MKWKIFKVNFVVFIVVFSAQKSLVSRKAENPEKSTQVQ